MNLLPRSEAEDRLRRLQAWMAQAGAGAVFVLQSADLFYFSGTVQSGLLALPAEGEPVYLVSKSLSRARAESPWGRLVPMHSLRKAPDILAGEGLGKLGRIGLELDVLPASYYLRFQSLFPDAELLDASDAIRRTRMVKSEYEVGEMREAAGMLERAFAEMPSWLRPGVTELEVHAELERCLRRLGHQGLTRMRGLNHEIAYGTLSAGASACAPTGFPGPVGFVGLYPAIPNGGSRRRLEPGDTLMADIVGGFGGYIADQTRVFALGELSADLERAHDFALELVRGIESMLRPGRLCSEIYRETLRRVQDSPYAERFMGLGDSVVRFVGHGVGLELDDLPVLAAGFDYPLEPGMTIAVEPKIFFPERGGVGVEDTYLVTPAGCERLTQGAQELVRVTAG